MNKIGLLKKVDKCVNKFQKKVCNSFTDSRSFRFAFIYKPIDLRGESIRIVQLTEMDSYLEGWLTFAFILYVTGLLGRRFNRKNFIVTRRSIEIMYLGIIASFVIYGNTHSDPRGAVYGLLLLILAACESAVGLGILLILHRFGDSVRFNDYQELGG